MTVYNKLVRDRIPEIIAEREGQAPKTRILTEKEYRVELAKKLNEEVAEYQATPNSEELADILEVVYALAAVHNLDPEALEQIRQEKATPRGGFSKKIFLIEA